MKFKEETYESAKAVVVEFIATLDNKEDFDTVNSAIHRVFKNAGVKSYLTRFHLWKRLFTELGYSSSIMDHWRDFTDYEDTNEHQHLCVLCGKPYKINKQRELCRECIKRIERIAKKINKDGLDLGKLLYMRYGKGMTNVLLALEFNPGFYNRFPIDKATSIQFLMYYRGQNKMNMRRTRYENLIDHIPMYITEYFHSRKHLELYYINGSALDPDIRFKCFKCGQVFTLPFSQISSSDVHPCKVNTSSGEAVVDQYLRELKVKYYRENKTIRCVNPETGATLPYDFEIRDKKIIIEVNGGQHYKFSKGFHGNEDGFEYQKQKDDFKRIEAMLKGYIVIDLTYDDIQTDRYKKIISDALKA